MKNGGQQDPALAAALDQWRDGAPAGIGEIYRRFFGPVRGILRRRMGEQMRAVAESMDVVQEVFIRVMATQPPPDLEAESDVVNYLATAVENCLRDLDRYHSRQKRDRGRQEALPPHLEGFKPPARTASPSEVTMGRETYERFLRVLQTLPERQLQAILLAQHLGCSSDEAARRLGLGSSGAFRTILGRALANVTLRMQAAGPSQSPAKKTESK